MDVNVNVVVVVNVPPTALPPRPRLHRTALAVLAAALLFTLPALAHDPFEVTTDAHIAGAALQLHTTLSLLTAGRVCFPERGRSRLLAAEFSARRPALETCARAFFRVTEATLPLTPSAVTLTPTVENDLDVRVSYPRPTRSPLQFDALFLRRLTQPSAGVVLTVTGEHAFLGQQVLRAESPTLEVSLAPESAAHAPAPSFLQFLALGVRHILTGYDHLLFLLALLIACRGWRAVLGVVTCFTVAHSITLALAGMDLVRFPARVVEPLIAATIVAVGVENLVQSRRKRQLARSALSLTPDESPQNSARRRMLPVPSPVRGGGLGRGETLRAAALAPVVSRKACPLPSPLRQTGEGTGKVRDCEESGADSSAPALSRGRERGLDARVADVAASEPPRTRYILTFAFGLLHGFGFAMALREIGLGARGAPILRPLLGFNLGVELGQVVVAAVALPLLWQLRRRVPLFARYGGHALSAALAGVGLLWLLQRLS